MRTLVVCTGSLFGHDEARLHATRLCRALADAGHSVELTTLPCSSAIADLVPQTTAFRQFDLRHAGDVCVAIGQFSQALQHENKRLWVFSQYSPFYEHWNTSFGAVTASQTNIAIREHVRAMDRVWNSEARLVCAASASLRAAISVEDGTPLKVIYPPPLEELEVASASDGDHLLSAGLLRGAARLPLLISAFGRSARCTRLVIHGYEVQVEEREYVEQLIAESPRADRISLVVDPTYEQFRRDLSSAAGFVSMPFRALTADAFTVAAGWAGKAVLTTDDSGETAHLIENGADGLIVESEAVAIAEAMDEIQGNRQFRKRLGTRLSAKLHQMLPSWDAVAAELTK